MGQLVSLLPGLALRFALRTHVSHDRYHAGLAVKLDAAGGKLKELENLARDRGRVAAEQADAYVHENPWQAIAIGAAIAAVIGVVLGLLLNRR
jgi:ElaB/YqjD/DUF883 family membrane-anchored ribosome-binding protein